jgi:hypothetical protein
MIAELKLHKQHQELELLSIIIKTQPIKVTWYQELD